MKSLRRIFTLADKEWIQVRRDSRSLILALLAPSLLVLLFGYALNVDVTNVSMGIMDLDNSHFSRQFREKFSNTEYLNIKYYPRTYGKIDKLIDTGDITMALVIPVDFEKRFKAGKQADVQLLVDGSDSTAATIAMTYIKVITYSFNNTIILKELKRLGIPDITPPVDFKTRIWYNPRLESKNFIIPGLIVLILAIISALITSLTISREWERGTMETFITTPVKGYEVIIGKLIPYIFIGIFDVVLAMSIGYFIFKVPFIGSFTELWLISLLFLIGTSCLGLLISAVTRVQVLSIQFAMVITYLPSFILSDFIFPIKNMPIVVQAITYIIPAKYLVTVLKGIALKGIGHSVLWVQIIFLFIFCLLVFIISIKKFKVQLPED